MNQLGKFNGMLLVSDFDDTLYEGDMRITRENVEALICFIRGGDILTAATGRIRPNFAPHASHTPINAPVILSSGSALHDFRTEEMIYGVFLPNWMREDLQQMTRTIPTIGFEAYHHDAIYVYQPSAVTQRRLEQAGMTAQEVPTVDVPPPWNGVTLQQGHEALLYTQRYLLEWWGGHYEAIFSSRVLLELIRKGSSKGSIVQCLARHLGTDVQHICCARDNQSDIPMLAVSAVPFAPVNCAPEVKQWSTHILSVCQESCVAQIVDILGHTCV